MRNLIFLSVFLMSISGFTQKTLPDISLKTFEGEKVSVTDLTLNGKTAIISLWATWCVPCINELDDIHKEIEKWDEANVKIVAISTDDSRTKRRVKGKA